MSEAKGSAGREILDVDWRELTLRGRFIFLADEDAEKRVFQYDYRGEIIYRVVSREKSGLYPVVDAYYREIELTNLITKRHA